MIVSLNEYRTVCNDILRNSSDPNEIKPLYLYNNLFSIDNIFNIVYLYNIYILIHLFTVTTWGELELNLKRNNNEAFTIYIVKLTYGRQMTAQSDGING